MFICSFLYIILQLNQMNDKITGSCQAVGYSNSCCLAGSCQGSSSSICRCDVNCLLFEDCCSDVAHDCEEQGTCIILIIMIIMVCVIIIVINHDIAEMKEYILIANRNFVHRIDINVRSYRLQTLLSNLKNVISLDYHYRY